MSGRAKIGILLLIILAIPQGIDKFTMSVFGCYIIFFSILNKIKNKS